MFLESKNLNGTVWELTIHGQGGGEGASDERAPPAKLATFFLVDAPRASKISYVNLYKQE